MAVVESGLSIPYRSSSMMSVKEQRSILHEVSKRKANWNGYVLRRSAFYNGVLKER
jgi:hypothetical protein